MRSVLNIHKNSSFFVFPYLDKTNPPTLETEIRLEDFPSPEQLWHKLCLWKGYTEQQLSIITQDYYDQNHRSQGGSFSYQHQTPMEVIARL
ncbi:hypothetical protein [Endozoicomonas sp. GU-1]|uniref:hypothetical protein n=1 Tax=Endozoicomonas sp. GU-1 TaxID=3009078 RepID=UPI0022B54F70|nr:hypothetical protein [Endozoicomonas sp. GU-1]WBA81989.1 hypothetical protein O2T12_02135 [Endozoicomonas sp. GU-1]WBA84938.1 hypothetical protein O3276_16905 [Endozoicomonas sp. GU-1]